MGVPGTFERLESERRETLRRGWERDASTECKCTLCSLLALLKKGGSLFFQEKNKKRGSFLPVSVQRIGERWQSSTKAMWDRNMLSNGGGCGVNFLLLMAN